MLPITCRTSGQGENPPLLNNSSCHKSMLNPWWQADPCKYISTSMEFDCFNGLGLEYTVGAILKGHELICRTLGQGGTLGRINWPRRAQPCYTSTRTNAIHRTLLTVELCRLRTLRDGPMAGGKSTNDNDGHEVSKYVLEWWINVLFLNFPRRLSI